MMLQQEQNARVPNIQNGRDIGQPDGDSETIGH